MSHNTYQKKEYKMGNIIETLRELNIGEEDFVYLNYEDHASVWHISDDYIEVALNETDTAQRLAALLATPGVRVYSRYEDDILHEMRELGLLEDYDREGGFEDYLTATITAEAYDHDLLTISTERHDHKRGTCDVAANVKVRAGDLYGLGDSADSFVSAFDVVVQTMNGTLTLS